jgi:hypothetical protein
MAVEGRCRRGGEDGVAFELHQREVRLDALDDRAQQVPENRVGGRDASTEIDPVLLLDTGHEAGVAGDVGEEQVPLAALRISPERRP